MLFAKIKRPHLSFYLIIVKRVLKRIINHHQNGPPIGIKAIYFSKSFDFCG